MRKPFSTRRTFLSTLVLVTLLTMTAITSVVINDGVATPDISTQEGVDYDSDELNAIVNRVENLTEWYDPEGGLPITYEEWLETIPEPQPFNMTLVYVTPIIPFSDGSTKSVSVSSDGSDPSLLLIVNDEIYDDISGLMGTYVPDLELEGYTVSVYRWTGDVSDPEPLKAWIVAQYIASPFNGMVFVGNMSVAWYENDHDAHDRRAEFPTDLYFMDLDGNWTDSDSNGMFESHMDGGGDTAPEVWLGRLTASPLLSEDEVILLSNYFAKNHLYRIGALSTNRRALAYVDDDWVGTFTGVGNAYSDWDSVTDKYTTTADDYRDVRIKAGYELIHIMAHSSSTSHSWKIPNATDPSKSLWDGDFYGNEIPTEDPKAIFYNLFACSSARYVRRDYIGGRYIFETTLGLAVVGSTKAGGMWWFDQFYTPFGSGESIGESFLQWFQYVAPYDAGDIIWHYGMTLLGDPTLTQLNYAHDLAAVSQVPSTTTAVQGETVTIDVTVDNLGNATEVFETTAYYDGNTIGTLSTTLQGGDSTAITFNWNTAGVIGGTYQITATVDPNDNIPEDDETNNDCTSPATITILAPPIADPDGPYSGPEGHPGINFDASASYDPDGTIVEYAWDWDNEGTYDEFNPGPFAAHAWGDDYPFLIVGLRVKDNDDLYGYNTTEVTVLNVPPGVYAGEDQESLPGHHYTEFCFEGNFMDPGWLDIHTAMWDFGDGSPPVDGVVDEEHVEPDSTGTVNGVCHKYWVPYQDTYTVTLTVWDDDGGVGSDTLTITILRVIGGEEVPLDLGSVFASVLYTYWWVPTLMATILVVLYIKRRRK